MHKLFSIYGKEGNIQEEKIDNENTKKYILTRRYFVGNKSIFAKFVTCKSSNIKNIDLVAIKLPAYHLFIYKYKRIDSITGI